jgi:hypothetical protein
MKDEAVGTSGALLDDTDIKTERLPDRRFCSCFIMQQRPNARLLSWAFAAERMAKRQREVAGAKSAPAAGSGVIE